MIVEYHRPQTIQAALDLLSRKEPRTLPLGGGTHLSHYRGESLAIVDLCNLGLGLIEQIGNLLKIGATATLQQLVDYDKTPTAFQEILRFETNYNLRQTATAAGSLVSGDGKSPFISALVALDACIVMEPGAKKEGVGNWLECRAKDRYIPLITSVVIPLDVRLQYEFVGRSPQDKPMVSVAIGEWPNGRTRIVLGGFGPYPELVMDGTDLGMVDSAIEIACSQLNPPHNTKFILKTATTLTSRLLEK